jgi:hypothetical protein
MLLDYFHYPTYLGTYLAVLAAYKIYDPHGCSVTTKGREETLYIYSETCIRRNPKGPKIFSTLDKFPHYTKLEKKKKRIFKPIKIILPAWCIPVYKSESAALALTSR